MNLRAIANGSFLVQLRRAGALSRRGRRGSSRVIVHVLFLVVTCKVKSEHTPISTEALLAHNPQKGTASGVLQEPGATAGLASMA